MSVCWFVVFPSVGLSFIQSNPLDKWGVPKNVPPSHINISLVQKKDTGMFFGTPDTFERKHIRSEAVFICVLIVFLFVGLSVKSSGYIRCPKKCTTVPKKHFTCPKRDTGILFGSPDTFRKKPIRFKAASVCWFIVCPFVGLPVIQSNPPDLWGVPKKVPLSHKNVSLVQKKDTGMLLGTPNTFARNTSIMHHF